MPPSSPRSAPATSWPSRSSSTSSIRPCGGSPATTRAPTRWPRRSSARPGSPCSRALTASRVAPRSRPGSSGSSSTSHGPGPSARPGRSPSRRRCPRTRAKREARSIPFSSALPGDAGGRGDDLGVDPDRFFAGDHPQYAGHWRLGPAPWGIPDERLLAKELRGEILDAVDDLSESQREVLTLRDIAGWDSKDVCNALGLSEVNQRVLLHRARSKVRAAVEDRLGAVEETT